MRIDPKEQSYRDIYKLMVSSIVPRPIAFISTISQDEIANLAPFSYFTACCAAPPCVLFSTSTRPTGGGIKDTLANVIQTGEFVVNIVSEEMAEEMSIAAADFPPDVDEFKASGLTPLESELVKPPRIAESHVQMECKLFKLIPLSEGPGGATVVIGEVVLFHVTEHVLENPSREFFNVDPERLDAIGRIGGQTYVRTHDQFQLERPTFKR